MMSDDKNDDRVKAEEKLVMLLDQINIMLEHDRFDLDDPDVRKEMERLQDKLEKMAQQGLIKEEGEERHD